MKLPYEQRIQIAIYSVCLLGVIYTLAFWDELEGNRYRWVVVGGAVLGLFDWLFKKLKWW